MLCKQILGSKNWDIGLWNYEQYIMLEPLNMLFVLVVALKSVQNNTKLAVKCKKNVNKWRHPSMRILILLVVVHGFWYGFTIVSRPVVKALTTEWAHFNFPLL